MVKILIFRIGSLGDTCVAIPAFKLIRKKYPNAEIKVLTNFPIDGGLRAASIEMILGESKLINGYIEYPLGLNKLGSIYSCIKNILLWRPNKLIYLMPRRSKIQIIRDIIFFKIILQIKCTIGLVWDDNFQKNNYDNKTMLYEHESVRLLRLIKKLGSIDIEKVENWELGLKSIENDKILSLMGKWGGFKKFIVCSIGTKWDSKYWGDDRWLSWAESFSIERPGYGLVMIGVEMEFELSEKISKKWKGLTLNLCGKLTPRESAALISYATLFVGHDSGPMHLAKSVGTPIVAVFSAQTLAGIWFPLGGNIRILYHKTECAGCALEVCIKHNKKCIRSITVSDLNQEIGSLLNECNR